VEWVSAGRADTGFVLGGTNGDTITCNFDGRIRIHYTVGLFAVSIPAFIEATAHAELNGATIQRSGSFSANVAPAGTGLLGQDTACNVCEVVVTSGDTIKVAITPNAGGALQTSVPYSGIVIERLQEND
jgi:hypothetical protein